MQSKKPIVKKIFFLKFYLPIFLFLLVACQSTAVTNDAAEVSTKISKWSEMWTVILEADYSEWRYTIQAPKGTFWFPTSEGVFPQKRLAQASSVRMAWHYPSGTPEYVWKENFLPEGITMASPDIGNYIPRNELVLSTDLQISDNAEKDAKIVSIFDLKKELQKKRITDKGLIWNGKARKYESFDNVYYELLDRHEDEAYIIYCLSKTIYFCNLKSIVIDDHLIVEYIMIPKYDLENWRTYQNKMLEWIKKTIIRKEKISKTQGGII